MIDSAGRQLLNTPTITAGAYSANDVIGGSMSFTLLPSESGRQATHGFITRVVITDGANIKAAMTLWLYKSPITTIADNGVFSGLSKVDNAKCIGWIDITAADYKTAGSGNAVADKDIRKVVETASGILTVVAVLASGVTYLATDDLTYALDFWNNPY